jgi:hypothetical protein
MSQIPYQELADIMAGEGFGEMSDAEVARLNEIVTKGFRDWEAADRQFRETAVRIRDAERGQTTEGDLQSFVERMGGVLQDGWKRLMMVDVPNGEPSRREQPAEVYQLPDGTRGFLGRNAGIGLIDDEGNERRIERIGLNTPAIAEALRSWIAEDERSSVSGAASCLVDAQAWAQLIDRHGLPASMAEGALVATYCVRRIDAQTPKQREVDVELFSEWLSPDGSEAVRAEPRLLAKLIRLLRKPRPKRTVPALDASRLAERERQVVDELRKSQPGEPLRAVFPLTAIWCEPES